MSAPIKVYARHDALIIPEDPSIERFHVKAGERFDWPGKASEISDAPESSIVRVNTQPRKTRKTRTTRKARTATAPTPPPAPAAPVEAPAPADAAPEEGA